ncbi:MAG TPA: glutathione peroxidase [Nocardioides sp.]|jgi:glutathione peroxidase|nr:glutathione peroxidase [Nocardioides sp.]
MTTISDFHATSIDGEDVALSTYAGSVVLVVNVASQCGLTPQYAGLQELYDEYAEQGLVVLGFPCDQFGHQEPGTEDEISAFCESSFGVTFPMFAKIEVNGDDTHPLYQWLKAKEGGLIGKDIRWNFAKFLIGRDGRVLKRFSPTKVPEKLKPRIEKALAEPDASNVA